MAPKKEQRTKKGVPSGTNGAHLRTRAPSAVKPEAGDTAELVGLRGRADLNGKRVEVESRVVGRDWWNAAWGRLAGRVSELLRAAGHSTVRVLDALYYTRVSAYFFNPALVAALVAAVYVSTTAAIVLVALVCWTEGAVAWWGGGSCALAAKGGHLLLLQRLRANGCPWDSDTCYCAVDQGHVEVLRWARANGCPWTAQIRDWAAEELGYTDDLGNLVRE